LENKQASWISLVKLPLQRTLEALKHRLWPGASAPVVGIGLVCSGVYVFVLVLLFGRAFDVLTNGNSDDIYKVLLPLAGAIGAPFVIWRTAVAHQQTGIQREGHYTSLFTRAVEQLGATREVKVWREGSDGAQPTQFAMTEANLEVRLGAIYALERIAQDSARDHWPIMEVLCAYVRNHSNCGEPIRDPGVVQNGERDLTWAYHVPDVRVDIQAILTVIGRRSIGRVRVEEARKQELDFTGANLQKAVLTGSFSRANFYRADLTGARVTNCDVARSSFFEASSLVHANVTDCGLEDTTTFLSDGILLGVSFRNCRLPRAGFAAIEIDRCRFYRCDLGEADFSGSTLRYVQFFSSNLKDADFEAAKFKGGSMGRSDLTEANFFGADLSDVSGLNTKALEKAFGDNGTLLPRRVKRPSLWVEAEDDENEIEQHTSAAQDNL
jgi:uncharacterized protein YjbI with pentapeptide repeats